MLGAFVGTMYGVPPDFRVTAFFGACVLGTAAPGLSERPEYGLAPLTGAAALTIAELS